MIGKTLSQYKILEKLGEVPKFPTSASQRVVGIMSIPTFSVGSYREGDL
jgi:hypothetical protein